MYNWKGKPLQNIFNNVSPKQTLLSDDLLAALIGAMEKWKDPHGALCCSKGKQIIIK